MKYLRNAAFLFALVSTAFGQSSEKRNLTLKEAVEIALEKNIDVIRAQNTMEAQQSAVVSAYGSFLPSLNARASWNRSEDHQPASPAGVRYFGTYQIPIGATPAIQLSQNYSSSLSLNMTLFDGFSNTAGLKKATSSAVSAEYSLYRTRQAIVFQAQSLYLQVLRNKSLLKVSQDNLKRSQQQLQRIIESNKVGAVAVADVYRQQVQTANDELALIRAESAYDNSKADLLFLLSLDVAKDYGFEDIDISKIDKSDYDAVKSEYSDYQKLVKQALETRPDYQAAVFSKQGAESDVTISRSSYYPTISANAGYSVGNQEFSKITNYKTLNWGLSFSLPIFNGFQTNTAVQSAELRLRNAEEQVSQAERQVQVDVKKALLNFETARKQMDVTGKNVISAEEDRKIAEERYNLGAGTLLDLLVANANYSKAASDNVNAAYDYLLAKQQLKYVIGSERY